MQNSALAMTKVPGEKDSIKGATLLRRINYFLKKKKLN
jgi:hypothetical protein